MYKVFFYLDDFSYCGTKLYVLIKIQKFCFFYMIPTASDRIKVFYHDICIQLGRASWVLPQCTTSIYPNCFLGKIHEIQREVIEIIREKKWFLMFFLERKKSKIFVFWSKHIVSYHNMKNRLDTKKNFIHLPTIQKKL